MANQYVNKVVINGITRLDLSGDTVTAGKLAAGYTAHDKSGAQITGTLDVSGGGDAPLEGTAIYMDSNVIVSGDVDFGTLVDENREFYILVKDFDTLQERMNGEVLFGHFADGAISLAYNEGSDLLTFVQSNVAANSGTLQCNDMGMSTFANCEYTVLYSGQSTLPSGITAGDTPVAANNTTATASRDTSEKPTRLMLSIYKTGRYRIKFAATNPYSASSSFNYKALARTYVNGTARGALHTLAATSTVIVSDDMNLSAGDTVTVYASSANATAQVSVSCLQACIEWDNGF